MLLIAKYVLTLFLLKISIDSGSTLQVLHFYIVISNILLYLCFIQEFARMSCNTELQLDLEELEKLEEIAQRPKWKQLLLFEKTKLQNEMQANEKAKAKSEAQAQKKAVALPVVKITSYAWDQSDKFVKIYLSDLKGIHNIANAEISVSTVDKMHILTVNNLNGKRYIFNVPKLLHSTTSISFKVKTDLILLLLKKEAVQKWDYLTELEKIKNAEKNKVPDFDKNDDPSASIMNMMKKMYDEGDDEMKRTIAKAWTESRDKVQVA